MTRIAAFCLTIMLAAGCASDRGARLTGKTEHSPFANYDKAIIRKIQAAWYKSIRQHNLWTNATVKVSLQLDVKGQIHNLEIKDNTGGEELARYCIEAIRKPSPFPPLPQNLRVLITNEMRNVNFTFYY